MPELDPKTLNPTISPNSANCAEAPPPRKKIAMCEMRAQVWEVSTRVEALQGRGGSGECYNYISNRRLTVFSHLGARAKVRVRLMDWAGGAEKSFA